MYYWILIIIILIAFAMYVSGSGQLVNLSENFSCPPKYDCSTGCSNILSCVNQPQNFKLNEKQYIPLIAPSGGWVPKN